MTRVTRSERVHLARNGEPARWLRLRIDRPETEELAQDPGFIKGCRHLAHRVLIQAFEDATRKEARKEEPETEKTAYARAARNRVMRVLRRRARVFLTRPSDGLRHWVALADLGLSVRQFCRGALQCFEQSPAALQKLFGGRGLLSGSHHHTLPEGDDDER